MHHLTCGISSLLYSINLILFTVLLVHLILRISPHHSHHLCSHHLSLPRLFTADVKFVSFTNPFLHSLSGSIRTAVTDFGLGLDFLGTGHCFILVMGGFTWKGTMPPRCHKSPCDLWIKNSSAAAKLSLFLMWGNHNTQNIKKLPFFLCIVVLQMIQA